MNDYMRALHQRFYREPDFSELEEDIENTRQEVRDCLDKKQRRKLMHLVDTQICCKRKSLWPASQPGLSWPGALQKSWRQTVCTLSTMK